MENFEVKWGQMAALIRDYRFDFNKLKIWFGRLHLIFDLFKISCLLYNFSHVHLKNFGAENFYFKTVKWKHKFTDITEYENSRTKTVMSDEPWSSNFWRLNIKLWKGNWISFIRLFYFFHHLNWNLFFLLTIEWKFQNVRTKTPDLEKT